MDDGHSGGISAANEWGEIERESSGLPDCYFKVKFGYVALDRMSLESFVLSFRFQKARLFGPQPMLN